jgi:DNA-binding LytR/AlgR family response regulator
MNIVFYGKEKNEFRTIKEIIERNKLKPTTYNFFSGFSFMQNYIDFFSDEQNIYFLTIEMKQKSGLEVAKQIRIRDKHALIDLILVAAFLIVMYNLKTKLKCLRRK